MDMNVKKHLDLLGMEATDIITGRSGIITTVAFDLFGCIQASINPGLDKDGKQMEQHWYDVARMKVTSKKPVMEKPNFQTGAVAEGKHGPAEKPSMSKQ